jgi:hypothetical protein
MSEPEAPPPPAEPVPPPAEPVPPPAEPHNLRGADAPRNWFTALPRLWSLRPVGAIRSAQATPATLALGAVTVELWMAIDWLESQPDPQFTGANIPLFAWYVLAAIALAGVLRWRSKPSPGFADALALAAGLAPVMLILLTLAVAYLNPDWLLGEAILGGLYVLIYLARGLRAITGKSQHTAAFAALLFLAGFVWLSDAFNVIPDVWNPADAAATADNDANPDGEAILFEQAARIDRSLALISRDTGAKPEAFFLGFAGVGDEKEFATEIGLAKTVLGERYGIGDRHVALINDERDLERMPLATVSGLKYALRGIAARMRLDRDVLFLSISSHGSRGGVIAVSNSELPLKDLDDEDLADALRESGIQWRVIIISACYAGAFIDTLRDPRSIVITAAAADRTSFGCSSDRDLTYFGEAFYRDALPKARSLRDAFDKAKAALAVRERQEGVTASDPQAFFGADIEAKLTAFAGP